MRFFKAIAVDVKPLIHWTCVAKNATELDMLGLSDDPLVLPEDQVPAYIYNVCPLKIVEGELVNRTPMEMSLYESEFLEKQKINNQSQISSKLENSSDAFFTFLTKDFPMNQTARLHYLAIQNTTGKTEYNVMTTNGMTVEITAANKADFLEAYHEKLLQLTQPEEIL